MTKADMNTTETTRVSSVPPSMVPFSISLPTSNLSSLQAIQTMRLSFILPAVMAAIYCTMCNATANANQNKISMVHSLDAQVGDDASGRGFLRTEKEKAKPDTEERGIRDTAEQLLAKALAKYIINNPRKATSTYNKWEKKYTLSQLTNLLTSKKGKYDQVLNGYAIHLDLAA